jgi:hypothetical protein
MTMWTGAFARLLHGTRLIDVAFGKFQAARQEIVLALATDDVLTRYNDLAYTATEAYHPGAAQYRGSLFDWEEAALSRFFPRPPASVLVGAAGGGREAFALSRQGYSIVAFEPSMLVQQMATACPGIGYKGHRNGDEQRGTVEVCRARYCDMPVLRRLDATLLDLRERPPFQAGIIGWGSFSHLTNDSHRVAVLESFAGAVHGPILLSFFGRILTPGPPRSATGLRRLLNPTGARRPGYMFSVDVGVYRQLTGDDVRRLADAAGVDVLFLDTKAEWPHAIVQRRMAA